MSDLPPQDPPSDPPEDLGDDGAPAPDIVRAAEYALGLLEGEEAAAAEARVAAEPAFAAEAAAWTLRLHPLVEDLADVAPSVELWTRVARAAGVAQDEPVAASAVVAPAGDVVAFPTRALALWRAGAIAASVLAAACLVLVAMVSGRQIAPAPLLVAQLDPPATTSSIATEPLFTATLDTFRKTMVISPISPGPVDPRARELWLIPSDGKPRPAGLIDIQNTRPLPLDGELLHLAAAGAKLAVSLEPEGGAPGGAPTGPIIAAGVLARI